MKLLTPLILIGTISVLCVTSRTVLADLVEPLSYAENCLVVTNLEQYSEYVFIVSSNGKYTSQAAVIEQDDCFSNFALGANTAVLMAVSSDQFHPTMLEDSGEIEAVLTSSAIDIDKFHAGFLSDTGQIGYYELTITDNELVLTLTDSETTHSVYPSQENYQPLTSNQPSLLAVLITGGVFLLISIVSLMALIVLGVYLYRRNRYVRKPHP